MPLTDRRPGTSSGEASFATPCIDGACMHGRAPSQSAVAVLRELAVMLASRSVARRRAARRLWTALTLGVAACADETTTQVTLPPAGLTLDVAKVDPVVVAGLRTKDSLSVIVLGRNQLLERVGGLEQFQRERAAWTRQALRADVVARLRAIAESEQAEILATIGPTTRVRQLWIYDAVAGTLGRTQIAALSQLSSVAYIYANFGERVVFPTGSARVSSVAPNATASGFEPGRVPVAWNIRWLGVDRVWGELREFGAAAVIASIDNGVNYTHADLRSHLWKNPREILNN